ncbi:GNAT family N-acetyltransferase [Geothrix oryzisoli]|uniref:GNAT family N-acetyltransferase n=1 Tax=Geothrix oryzisoli TaxID=2922721 RepID=UPI001FABF8BB|nr:GNAT family N-acetyltransferase [Geothrix oryzisoli]
MSPVSIRPARLQDAAPLADLAGHLGYPSTERDLVDRLTTMLAREDHLVLVAEKEGEVLAWLHAFVALRVESPPFAEIGGLVVAPAARGQGVGGRLVRAALAWTDQQGLGSLRVRSNEVRRETHAFYLHLGFTAAKTQRVFSRPASAE